MKNTKPNLIRRESKENFLNIFEKDALEIILKNAFENLDAQNTEGRQIVSDILEKVTNANAVIFDYEDVCYLIKE
tara:strand:- start:97 stop:321 length:225 start_codon:yes stop_codon:yes gene_type:complete